MQLVRLEADHVATTHLALALCSGYDTGARHNRQKHARAVHMRWDLLAWLDTKEHETRIRYVVQDSRRGSRATRGISLHREFGYAVDVHVT